MYTGFEELIPQIEEWQRTLKQIDVVWDSIFRCQELWMYLYPLFTNQEIRAQMSVSSNNFDAADSTFQTILQKITRQVLVESSNQYRQVTAVDVVVRESNNQIVGDMNDCSVSLESIKVRLRAWLDEKRNIFPRFYFLSDDEMLFVLSSNSRTTKDERPNW